MALLGVECTGERHYKQHFRKEMFLSVAPKKIGQTAFGFNFCFLCLTTLRTLMMVQELREGFDTFYSKARLGVNKTPFICADLFCRV